MLLLFQEILSLKYLKKGVVDVRTRFMTTSERLKIRQYILIMRYLLCAEVKFGIFMQATSHRLTSLSLTFLNIHKLKGFNVSNIVSQLENATSPYI